MMFIIALTRVYLPRGTKIEGKPLGVISLSYRERLLLQRTNLYLIGFVMLIGVASGFLNGALELVAVLATFALTTIPARYTITNSGIAFNNVVYRPWSDFTGYREERRSIVLEAVEGQRDFRLHVLGANSAVAVKALARIMARSTGKHMRGGARAGDGIRP
jgi:hypothetical protein